MSTKPHTTKYFEEYISSRYHCKAAWIATVPMDKSFRTGIGPKSVVHVFELSGHKRAKRCYAWTYEDAGWHYATVLGVPPVINAESAVRAALARTKIIRRSL
jgi:hypothetical protein